jgi:hypothetical protein
MNGTPETTISEISAPTEEPTAANRPRAGAHRGHVAPSKRKSATKATPANKGNKGATTAKSPKKATAARHGSKAAKFLDRLKRAGVATLKELMKATGWQAHSVHGFMSGTLRKRMALRITSTKQVGGERRYSVKS